jgi:hypothetical protein
MMNELSSLSPSIAMDLKPLNRVLPALAGLVRRQAKQYNFSELKLLVV